MARATEALGVDPQDSLLSNAELIIRTRVDDLIIWERAIPDPNNVYELHQMRIAAKRLRYTMELFAPFYSTDFKDALEQIKAIQEHLGNIHDADVLVPQLQAHLQQGLKVSAKQAIREGVYSSDLEAATGLLIICRRKKDERKATYRHFLGEWRQLRKTGFIENLKLIIREQEKSTGGKRNVRVRGSSKQESTSANAVERPDQLDTGAGPDPGPVLDEGRVE